MTEQEIKAIEARYSIHPYELTASGQIQLIRTDIPKLIQAIRDRDKEIKELSKPANKCIGCGAIIDHDYCDKCRRNWES